MNRAISKASRQPLGLAVAGSIILDTIETPREDPQEVLGGSASHFAAAASIFVPVRVSSAIGDDFPSQHLDYLAGLGIDLAGIEQLPGKTFRWHGRYLDDMENRKSITTEPNVFSRFSPNLSASYRKSPLIFLANMSPTIQKETLDQVNRPLFGAIDTMEYWFSSPWREDLLSLLPRLDVLFLNESEAHSLTGENSLLKATEAIKNMGAARVIVKRGKAGALLFDHDGVFWVPASLVERSVDPTGAGDAFAGGFMGYLAVTSDFSRANLRKAMLYGSVMGTLACLDFGPLIITKLCPKEVIRRVRALIDMMSLDPFDPDDIPCRSAHR